MGTVPVLRTWVAGELVTAAYMNANVRDAGNFFQATPTFQGRQSTGQSIATSVVAPLLMDTEIIDSDNGHSTSVNTDRYTAATPGYYVVAGGVGFTANATGMRCAWAYFNGATVLGSSSKLPALSASITSVNTRVKIIGFNGTTDYAQIVAFQNSGISLTTWAGNEDASDFSAHWIRS